MNNRSRNVFVYILIIAAIAAIIFGVRSSNASSKEIPVSQLVSDINAGKVSALSISDEGKVTATYDNEVRTAQLNPTTEDVVAVLVSLGANANLFQNGTIEVEFTKPSNLFNWIGLIGTFLRGRGIEARHHGIAPRRFSIQRPCVPR